MEDNRSIENEESIFTYLCQTIRSPSPLTGSIRRFNYIQNYILTNFSVVFFNFEFEVIKKARINGDQSQKSRIMNTIYEQ